MRIIFTVFSLMALVGHSFGQTIYTSDTSMVSFFSATPVEDIEAFNSASTSLLNVAKSEIVFRVPISGFQLEKPLMQEHFNENYMETEKFPYATFKGKLSDSLDISKDTIYNVTATGMMNIHGQDRAETYNGLIICKDGRATMTCDFAVILKNHKIMCLKLCFPTLPKQLK